MNCIARLLTPVFLFFLLTLPGLGATLDSVVISNVSTGSACTPGPAVSTIAPTDEKVVVYIGVLGGLAGDVIRIEFVRPDGVLYTGGSYNPLNSAGDWCFAPSIDIAGTSATDYPGDWTVRGYWNGALMFTRTFTLGGAGGGGATGSCPAGGTNLLQNGSFELPGGSFPYLTLQEGSGFIPNWQVLGEVDYVVDTWPASDGSSSIDLNGFRQGAVEQTIATVPGETYTVCFDLAGNAGGGAAVKTLEVLPHANGSGSGVDFQYDTTGQTVASPQWVTRSMTFVAVAAATTIQFYSTTTGAHGPAIDNVRLYGAAGGGGGGSCVAGGPNLLRNGSFELPGGNIGSHREVPAGDPFITNWTTGAGGVDYVQGAWAPSEGKYFAHLNDTSNGSLEQTVATIPGETYTLCFDLSGNVYAGPATKTLQVTAVPSGTGNGGDFTFDITGKTPQLPGWIPKTFSFVATGTQTTIRFFSTTSGVAGPAIDNVRLYGKAGGGSGGGSCIASGPNRVLNPSFELPGGSIGGHRFVAAGDTFIPNWTVDRGGVDYVQTAWTASDGSYSIDMNSSTNGMILQKIATVPGETYTVCVDLSGNMLSGPGTKELEVAAFANGQGDGLDLTFDITGKTPQDPGWTTHSFTVVAPSSEITLEFFSNTTGTAGPAIDNVRMYGPAASGGGGTPGCDYFVSPEQQTVSAAGTSGIILVTTGAGCAVTATSNVPWITIQTSGSSAVGYTVAANPLSSPRVGTITIGGRAVTITQEAAQPCTYNILPGSASVAAGGESRSVTVTTSSPTCGWTAITNAAWIAITGGATGTGGGTVSYTAGANSSTTARSGTMTIAGKTFTVNQAGAAPAGGMVLGGVVNAASYVPSNLPAGALAQGSFFSLFGTAIGPEQWVQAIKFPLPASEGLGGVTIKIQKAGQEVWAALHFVASTQANGIIPSNAPLGDCIMVLSYQGMTAQIPVTIVKHNFGVFSLQAGRGPGIVQNWNSQTDVPLNTAQAPAQPGQLVVIWGTGLGPIQGPDNMAPPVGDLPYNIKVTIGGKAAEKVYGGRAPDIAAVDVIYVKVPMDAPTGCYVPLQVEVEGAFSNTVTMAVGQPGMQCDAASGIPFLDVASQGGKSGVVILLRAALLADILDPDAGITDRMELELDVALGLFLSAQPYTGTGNILSYLPPVGSCQSMASNQDLGGLLEGLLGNLGGTGGDLPGGAEPLEYGGLNAGGPLTLKGSAGTKPLDLADEEQPGVYVGLLGGTIPDLGILGFPGSLRARLLSMPPFLDGGAYTLKGPGGPDVGAFEKEFDLPNQVRWTNRDQTATVRRNQGVTLNWSGGDNSKLVLIVGGSADEASEAVGGFLCIANASAGQFAVPASATANMPLTGSAVSTDIAGGILGMAVLPRSNMIEFSAPGLDRGLIVDGLINLRTVGVQ